MSTEYSARSLDDAQDLLAEVCVQAPDMRYKIRMPISPIGVWYVEQGGMGRKNRKENKKKEKNTQIRSKVDKSENHPFLFYPRGM